MPYVRINETDSTIHRNMVNTNDNIVLIPGTAITGPIDTPVLCESYKDFIATFGKTAPVNDIGTYGTSWDYAANMLLAGMSVLYYRVGTSSTGTPLVSYASADMTTDTNIETVVRTYLDASDSDVTNTVSQENKTAYDTWVEGGSVGENPVAQYINSHNDITNTETSNVVIATIKDKFGGSYGNTYAYTIHVSNTSVVLKVYTVNTVNKLTTTTALETIKLADISNIPVTSDDYGTQVANKILNTWGGLVDGEPPVIEGNYVYVIFNNDEGGLVSALSNIKTNTNLVMLTGGADADNESVASEIANVYPKLTDKFLYDFKFITSGGYTDEFGEGVTVYPISDAMVALAEERQDCICFIDPSLSIPANDLQKFYQNFNSSYATAYAPWAYMKTEASSDLWMPPSYIFLQTLASSIKSGNALWNPPAGVRRASVSGIIKPQYEINSALLDAWQNTESTQCINPIMKLRQYGYVIYGQKTLYYIVNNDMNLRSALQELGVRLTANEIKRAINLISISMTFESNNIRTWNEFRGKLDPYLLQMKADHGLNSYEIIMDNTTTSDDDINNNIIRGTVKASIARAAEKFIIGFELTSSSSATMVEEV